MVIQGGTCNELFKNSESMKNVIDFHFFAENLVKVSGVL